MWEREAEQSASERYDVRRTQDTTAGFERTLNPRNIGSLYDLEKATKWTRAKASRRGVAPPTP